MEAPKPPFVDELHRPGPGGSSRGTKRKPTTKYRAGVEYQQYTGPRRPRRNLIDPNQSWQLATVLVDVVRVEGPIVDELLLERLREIHGVGRAGANIRANFRLAIKDALASKLVEVAKEVKEGRFEGRIERMGMKDGVVSLVLNPRLEPRIPADVKQRVEQARAAILAGMLTVPTAEF